MPLVTLSAPSSFSNSAFFLKRKEKKEKKANLPALSKLFIETDS
jgi:hypothetical protein